MYIYLNVLHIFKIVVLDRSILTVDIGDWRSAVKSYVCSTRFLLEILGYVGYVIVYCVIRENNPSSDRGPF